MPDDRTKELLSEQHATSGRIEELTGLVADAERRYRGLAGVLKSDNHISIIDGSTNPFEQYPALEQVRSWVIALRDQKTKLAGLEQETKVRIQEIEEEGSK
jgi:hypothetical protein